MRVSVAVLALLVGSGVARSEMGPGVATAEFTAGDFTLYVEATKRVKKRQSVSGSLTLRPLATDFDDGLGHPYYGWTDVDFLGLGAAMSATAVSPTSRDPENPGVLAVGIPPGMGGLAEHLRVPSFGGTVMLLVGTESNRKATRMNRDGGVSPSRHKTERLGVFSENGQVMVSFMAPKDAFAYARRTQESNANLGRRRPTWHCTGRSAADGRSPVNAKSLCGSEGADWRDEMFRVRCPSLLLWKQWRKSH